MATSEDLSQYDFQLPEQQIAQVPAEPRDSSRLLVLHRREKRWEHRRFKDLPEYLDSKDRIVANNSRVMQARLVGYRIRRQDEAQAQIQGRAQVRGGRVECVLLEKIQPEKTGRHIWECLFHASAKACVGLQWEVPQVGRPERPPLRGQIVKGYADSSDGESPGGTVWVEWSEDPLESGAGELPLPPYIEKNSETSPAAALELDQLRYQTVYAKYLGSAAAPTAGLHFTENTFADLKKRGVSWEEITLHVGLGTFKPVKCQNIAQHVMHSERYQIPPKTALAISQWKNQGGRILAVGTTSVRTLESSWDGKALSSLEGKTALFIRPDAGFEFRVVDRLLTNFHLPRSTLLMLVCTFAGVELTLAAYQDAVREGYRFYSYGDAMLIL
jgi:S-adenosylmethionine:tRNA ribosyltransferase-isomerase